MKATLQIITAALAAHPRACIAFSGGTDSGVLVDIVYGSTRYRPPLLYVAGPLEYPQTEAHVRHVAAGYGAQLEILRPEISLPDYWQKRGWPMLGKLQGRTWSRTHRRYGFKCDCSGCCYAMKIRPARRWMRANGYTLQLTGTRGDADSAQRGMRTAKDGATHTNVADGVSVCTPLSGWTDLRVRSYTRAHDLPRHPLKAAADAGGGALGCSCCGGGAQFDGSAIATCRRLWPAMWRRFIVDMAAGEIVLAIKYDKPLGIVREAIARLGGLATLADTKPHLFDYLRPRPLPSYQK